MRLREYRPVETSYGALREVLRREWLGENSTVDQVFVASMRPGMVSAWHAHETSTDRLFVVAGTMLIVIYDNRPDSPSRGVVQEFRLSASRPCLLIIPPRLWHGTKNIGDDTAELMNAADIGYCYEAPDHWRVPPDSDAIPYRFG